MASSVFFIFLTIFLTCISLSSSEMLLLPLTHYLSTTQFNSTHHLLKSTSTRSATRFHHHRTQRQVSLPLSPGTDYTLSFSLGSDPPQTISLYMDTGSDLVWFPCSPFDCILCEGKYNPSTIPNPTPLNLSSSAASVKCKSRACSAAHSSLPSSDLCAMARCPLETIEISDCASFSCPPFYYAYGDGSFIARLYSDSLSIPMASPALVLRNFTFGCAHSALAEPIGVAGFGRGLLSLPAQLSTFSPQLGNRFSYCLVSHSFDEERVRRPSPLILGRYSLDNKEKKEKGVENEIEFVYTPMLDNPKHPYYYCVGLEAVTVGKRRIPAPVSLKRVDGRGNGGMVVDSGTTFTMLPAGLYESLVAEFDRRVRHVYKRASQIEDNTGLSPCYYLDDSVGTKAVPMVVLHFVGNSSVVLPRRNYFYEFLDGGDDGKKGKRKVGCVMLMNGGDEAESSGPVGTLGNYQQQGFEVVYDLGKRQVGFAKRKCASLWDSLNQR
ncbi:probable aspartyl protease At4g16563 [Cornus florida]|uniref:probable aspartyl protease At4g16563 n=1 Tax=Cornus florida TaxID=4283 RepID=UPI002896AF0C|nr:probable aspartyl protease At4g16563 [Cornus florida]